MLIDLQVLEYVKGRYEIGPPLYLGDDPEPEDTVYDTTGEVVGESGSSDLENLCLNHHPNQVTYPKTREDSNTAPAFKASIISQHH